MIIDSLKLWLELISNNKNNTFTHWQIDVVISEFIGERLFLDNHLNLKLYPLLLALKDKHKTHNHKALIAKFALGIIEEFEANQKAKMELDIF